MRREPETVRVRSRPIVPAPVMVPPVRPLLVATEVTVPFVVPMQVPFTAKHPPYGRLTPARVEVAVEEAEANDRNEENVEVPWLPTIEVVAVPPINKPL